jgi:eukaryotic-like serine/threonine-protein kinase
VTIQQYFGAEPRPNSSSRNRRAMLEKVWAIWITGILHPSLPHDILLDLGLTEHPAMVTRALDLYVQRLDLADHVQAPGLRLIDAFDRLDRALLILGAPGAGKTTLLLTLAQDLLIRAAQDPEHPIPVIFPLSSWAQQRRPLVDWLVDALNEQYDVPRKTGRAWIEANQILPLLDGLDEVAPEHRAACVEAINTFRQEHGLLPLVVCSRVVDYEALGTRLQLQGALVVQPLTRAQVDSYLTQVAAPLVAVRQALQEDSTFWELLDTPLMLTIVTLAYAGESVEMLRQQGTPAERRQHLFATYVDWMFRRRHAITPSLREQTERWLAWLAWQLTQHSQTIFYLEGMQPDWLPPVHRWVPTQGARLLAGLVGVLGGLLVGLVSLSLDDGLVNGLFLGLAGGLAGYSQEITWIETTRWSWSGLFSELLRPSGRRLVGGLVVGLGTGLLIGLGTGLKYGLTHGLAAGLGVWFSVIVVSVLGIGLGSGLVGGLVLGDLVWLFIGLDERLRHAVVFRKITSLDLGPSFVLVDGLVLGLLFGLGYKLWVGFVAGLSGGEIATKTTPKEGIYRSARIALISGLGLGLGFGLVSGLLIGLITGQRVGLAAGQLVGLLIGLSTGLRYGGRACLQHALLRLGLRYHGLVPWHYVNFLDYAADRIFLRKAGGGYLFVHRQLQDYFAARHANSGGGAASS